MEITIRHVHVLDVSPQFAELLGRLLGVAGGHSHDRPAPMPPAVPAETGGGDVGAREATSLDVSQVSPPLGAAAPAAETGEGKRGAWRTMGRRAVLTRMYSEGAKGPAIRAALLAVGGPPLPVNDSAFTDWARDLGIARSGDPAAKKRKGPQGGYRTPERDALLERDWPAGRPVHEIFEDMNRLSGKPVPAKGRLSTWAKERGLKRPEGFRRADAARVGVKAARAAPRAATTGDGWAEILAWAETVDPDMVLRGTPAQRLEQVNDLRRLEGLRPFVVAQAVQEAA